MNQDFAGCRVPETHGAVPAGRSKHLTNGTKCHSADIRVGVPGEVERFREKVAAGAQFAMSQICYDLDDLDRFAELAGGWKIPVLAGIFPLTSYSLALRLNNEVPGIVVPQSLQDEL